MARQFKSKPRRTAPDTSDKPCIDQVRRVMLFGAPVIFLSGCATTGDTSQSAADTERGSEGGY